MHASRILPGFLPDNKIRMLATMKDKLEAIVCVNCQDIQKSKERGDLGITYDIECLRMIEQYQSWGIRTGIVVLTMYAGQPEADIFRKVLEQRGVTDTPRTSTSSSATTDTVRTNTSRPPPPWCS